MQAAKVAQVSFPARSANPVRAGELVTIFVARRTPGILQISEDLRWGLESAPYGRELFLWDLASGRSLACLCPQYPISWAQFCAPDHLLVGHLGVEAWRGDDGVPVSLPFLGVRPGSPSCSEGGLFACATEFVSICDLSAGRAVAAVDPRQGPSGPAADPVDRLSTSVAVRPDGLELAICSEVLEEPHYWCTYLVERYSLPEAHSQGPPETIRTGCRSLAPVYSPEGRYLAVPLRDGEVLLWDLSTGRALPALPVRAESFCFAGPGWGLVLQESRLSLWDLESGAPQVGVLEIPHSCQLRASQGRIFCESRDGWWVLDAYLLVSKLGSQPGEICLPVSESQRP